MPIILPPPPKERLLPKNVEEYFLEEIKGRSHLNTLEYESFDYTHSMELLRHRQETACLDAILGTERKKHADKQLSYRERWLAAAKQMKQTDEAIVILDERYKDALEDKQRQLQIAARQDELRAGKETEVRRLQKEALILKEVQEQTTQRLMQFKPVEKYLQRVQDLSQGEFRTVRELTERFNLLRDTRNNLVERDDAANETMRRRQAVLDDLLAVKENESILLNNYIFELTEELESLGTKASVLEEELTSIKTTAANRALNLSKVRMATYNLYRQACKMMDRMPSLPPIDTVRQLNYIQGSVIEINRLRRQLQAILKKAVKKYALETAAKEKAERIAQLHRSRHAKSGGPSKNLVAFGLKEGDTTPIDEPIHRHFSFDGKMRPVIEDDGPVGTVHPEIGGRVNRGERLSKGHGGKEFQSHPVPGALKPKLAVLNQYGGIASTKPLPGPKETHVMFSSGYQRKIGEQLELRRKTVGNRKEKKVNVVDKLMRHFQKH